MAVPWLRLFDTALGLASMARSRREVPPAGPSQELEAGSRTLGGLETRLAGVVVAALKEAFDRDTRRLELEREQVEAERRRAALALKLELRRQATDLEIGRFRLLAGVAAASWLGTLFFSSRLMGGPIAARALLGTGWALLLASMAAAFIAQTAAERAMQLVAENPAAIDERHGSSTAGQMAPWLIVCGLALVGLAVLVA